MIFIRSIEVEHSVISVEANLTLANRTRLGLEIHLYIDSDNPDDVVIQPIKFGGCLCYDPDKKLSIEHCDDADCNGNDLSLIKTLDDRGLISLTLSPHFPPVADWNITRALDQHFHVGEEFSPTEEWCASAIRELVEIAFPEDMLVRKSKLWTWVGELFQSAPPDPNK